MSRTALVMVALAGLQLGCQRTHAPAAAPESVRVFPWFEDITERFGLDFVHDAGPVGDYFMPQQVGSGAALFDFNNDGRLDIYLLQNGGPKSGSVNRLYQQMPDGRFRDVSNGSGLDIDGHNMGVAVGDVNNDGWLDVLVTQYNGVQLFLNTGKGSFTDITSEAGLSNPGWATSAAFFDYDRDGWLDLIVVNYVDYDPTWPCKAPNGKRDYCAPKTFRGRVSRLFHNRGGGGMGGWKGFADVTEASGLGRLAGPGLGVVCADFDGDGWPDIFIANDGKPNHLWINQKNGQFTEQAVVRGLAYNGMGQAQAGMGIALGDVDSDGLLDVFVTHLTEEGNTLWRQGPPGLYRDHSAAGGFMKREAQGTGFGTLLADFDHDGTLDLAVVNGRVSALATVDDWSLGPFWSWYGERNRLFHGDGRGRFEDLSRQNPALCGRFNVARGLVRGDIDGDGAVDLLVTTIGGPARLFKNVAPRRGHWLQVQAIDPTLHRDALGAVVRIRSGGRTQIRSLHPAEGYLCSSEISAHFGLGDASRIDDIEIIWPDGCRETFPRGAREREMSGYSVDQSLELRKGEGRTSVRSSAPPGKEN
ncbi:MAG TPA: CRTAC1 family protein [Gemmataceae bacterium]|nr:CRTAC1 family protein [Gemmataceae bacterium]